MGEDSKDIEAVALFEIVASRYGDRLDSEQLEEVRKGVVASMELARALRAVRLDSSVEPFSTFRPYRGEETGD